MCGRFSISLSKEEVTRYLKDEYAIEELKEGIILPRFNIAPSQMVLTVINDGQKYRAGLIKWGFVPSFAKDENSSFGMINAKAETLREKPAFRTALKTKRCIILADGFYEWQKSNQTKLPMRFQVKNQKLFPMAGLWSTFVRPDGSKLYTCIIITCEANELMKNIHNRMPVILDKEAERIWLNPKEDNPDTLSNLLIPYDSTQMMYYKISSLVNNASNESKDIINEI